jgi:hypothetical protein
MSSQHDTLDGFRGVAATVNAGTPGKIVGHSRVEADQRFEEGEYVRWLDDSLTWIHLGFAYVLIRIDRSLFEVFNASALAGDQLQVRTVRTEGTVASINGGDYGANPWGHVLQGVPKDRAKAFIDFVASYRFVRKGPPEVQYLCNFQEVQCADPSVPDANSPRRIPIWFALPSRGDRKLVYYGEDLVNKATPPRFCMTKAAL